MDKVLFILSNLYFHFIYLFFLGGAGGGAGGGSEDEEVTSEKLNSVK